MKKSIWLDLLTVLWDALAHGDLRGHLAAWWEVYTGSITPQTRWTVCHGL